MRLSDLSVTRSRPLPDFSGQSALITGVTIVGALYFAREILIPFALAVLISFVLSPLASLLRRTGLPRAASVIVVVTLSFGAILGIGAIGASQIAQLAEKLPQYQANLQEKIRAVKGATSSNGAVSQATKVIEDLGREISKTTATPQPNPAAVGAPIPVEIHAPNTNPLKVASELLQPILGPLASTGLVVIFVIFLLLQREDLRDRVIRLLGTKSMHRTTEAMDEAATKLSRYFLLQTVLNAGFGIVVGLGLWLIGVPSPLLWAIFTMLLRFVPYIGSIIAAALPVALAAAVDPGWSMVGWTIALFAIGEPLMGQAIEPLVFGHQTGLSPVAIVVAATFWTWLWGPIGLVLATPLTLCLVILGQYTQRLEFLNLILGDQPPLTPSEGIYQRLIAHDPVEVFEQAEQQLKEKTLVDYYDQVVLPGLALAQRDVRGDELASERQQMLLNGVYQLVENLAEHQDVAIESEALNTEKLPAKDQGAPDAKSSPDPVRPVEASILSIGGSNTVDHAAAALFAHASAHAGLGVKLPESQGLAGIAQTAASLDAIQLVCVSFVGDARASQIRFIVRRIRRRFPGIKVMIGLWGMMPGDSEWERIKVETGVDFFVTSFKEALATCVRVTDVDNAFVPTGRLGTLPATGERKRGLSADSFSGIATTSQGARTVVPTG